MLENYKKHCDERAQEGIPPLPLNADQVAQLTELIKVENSEAELLIDLLENRVPAGVDQAAYVKAGFLADIAKGKTTSPYITKQKAVKLLGTMLGGYNIAPLIECLKDHELGKDAAEALSNTLLIFDAFNEIFELSKTNEHAKEVIDNWAQASWFTGKKN